MICARILALLNADFGATCEFDFALLRLLRQGQGRARIYARLSDVPRGPKGAGGRGGGERKGNSLTRRPSSPSPDLTPTAFTQLEFALLFIEFRGAAAFSFCAKRGRKIQAGGRKIQSQGKRKSR